MEGPITKFIHVQQQDTFWTNTTPYKSPDLIELNSDSERNIQTVEPLNYSSSQDEVETEDDGNDAPESAILGKDGGYDVTSHDEESCHLLQTEEDSENSDSEHEEENICKSSDSHCSRGSNRGSSASDNGPPRSSAPETSDHVGYEAFPYTKIWSMTPEQREYYTKQFLHLQPDINGLISGDVAKPFFEKSRLPLEDLRNIWQLADITEDGLLDMNEFRIAMHFVVVRKHGLPIPSDYYDHVGDSRRNSLIQHAREQEYQSSARTSTNQCHIGGHCPSTINGGPARFESTDLENHTGADIPPATQVVAPGISKKIGNTLSSVDLNSDAIPSIPGQAEKRNLWAIQKSSKDEWTTFDNEPVNFSSICDTSGLVAPIPVRLTTPEENLMASHTNAVSGNNSKVHQLQLKSIQRPKLSAQHPKSIVTGTIAPPPPPRRKTHVRSSSLDLNRLTISSEIQPMANGPDTSRGRSFLSPSHQGGAFSVYRKPHPPPSDRIHEVGTDLHEFRQFKSSIQNTIEELRNDVNELRNDNTILTRITTQLLEQLAALQTKRKYLTFQLHQVASDSVTLKSTSSTLQP